MRKRTVGNEYRTIIVCMDACRDGLWAGRLYNFSIPEGVRFSGLMSFLMAMEDLLDQLQLPQSFTAKRAFAPLPEADAAVPPQDIPPVGREATFAVRVLFRQNATWQGAVTWMETRREESFRSALELLLLMQSVTGSEKYAKTGTRFSALVPKAE